MINSKIYKKLIKLINLKIKYLLKNNLYKKYNNFKNILNTIKNARS